MTKRDKNILSISVFLIFLLALFNLLATFFMFLQINRIEQIIQFNVNEIEDLKEMLLEKKTSPTTKTKIKKVEFTDGTQGGCSDYFVYAGDEMQILYVTVEGRGEFFGDEWDQGQEMEIGEVPFSSGLTVKLHQFDPPLSTSGESPPFCNDIVSEVESTETVADSGTVTIMRTDINEPENSFFDTYSIDVTLEDVTFNTDKGELVVEELYIDDITVGWLPG